MRTLKLVDQNTSLPAPLTGEQVFALVGDLIAEHLSAIPFDDPYRGVLSALYHSTPPNSRGRR